MLRPNSKCRFARSVERVQEERRRQRSSTMPGGEPVEAVDQVDRLGHAEQPEHGDQRLPVGATARSRRRTARGSRRSSRRTTTVTIPASTTPVTLPGGAMSRTSSSRPVTNTISAATTTPMGSELSLKITSNRSEHPGRARTPRGSRRASRCRRRAGSVEVCTERSLGSTTQPTRRAATLTSGVTTNVTTAATAPISRYSASAGDTGRQVTRRDARSSRPRTRARSACGSDAVRVRRELRHRASATSARTSASDVGAIAAAQRTGDQRRDRPPSPARSCPGS